MEYSDTVLLKTQSAKPEKFMYSYLSNSNENINQSMVRNNKFECNEKSNNVAICFHYTVKEVQ